MSDRRRRRRAESGEETEEVPPRRRRYNTRSSARNEENGHSTFNVFHWSSNPAAESNSSFSVMGLPYRSFHRHSRDNAAAGRESQSGSSRRHEQDRSSSTQQRPTGSRAQDSITRSGDASASTSASTSAAQRSSDYRRSDSSRGIRRNGRVRRYAAMSTGGRAPRRNADNHHRREERPDRITGGRLLLRFPARRSLRSSLDAASARSTTNGSRDHGSPQARHRTRFTTPGHWVVGRSDESFSAIMRSLDLVRTHEIQRRRAILRIVDFTGGVRRTIDPPRPSRGANILRSSTSTPGTDNAFSTSRRRHSFSGRENSTVEEDFIDLPPSSLRPVNRSTSNSSTRDADGPSVTYMMRSGSGFNLRVAFGANEDENSESNDPTFSLSGASDVSTILSSMSDGDMSADDVFISDTDRLESDSGDSIESASTAASPHSLVSLSLNALHPSPSPSFSSAETDGHEEEEEAAAADDDEEDDNDSPALERAIMTSITGNVGNPIIFLHNNISVQLLSSMAELADAFSTIRNRLRTIPISGNATGQGEGFRGFTPPRYNMEPARRQVPESIDCQRAKLIDELNSNTAECVICTDLILAEERVWPCKNCFNIFHLHCIRRWAKTNRNAEMGGAWICPVCRRPKFCAPNRLRYRCLCGRLQQPKPTPGVTPHCCGKKCKRKCGLLCHPGPCKMSDEETAAVSKAMTRGQGPNDDPPTGSEQEARTVSV